MVLLGYNGVGKIIIMLMFIGNWYCLDLMYNLIKFYKWIYINKYLMIYINSFVYLVYCFFFFVVIRFFGFI